MATFTRNCIMAALLGLLVACGGGGGGDRASGVEPGPESPGGQVPPPDPIVPTPGPSRYAEAQVLLAHIDNASLDGDNRATVDFQLTDGEGVAIQDLEAGNVRFVIAKLQGSPLGALTGNWQSYINDIEIPSGSGPATEQRLQATYERPEADEELINNNDGTYSYTFRQSVSALPEDILGQAELEGLNLDFEPDRTHRVSIQFDGAPGKANPYYDWVPASGATSGIFNMDIAATANCNRCHDPLQLHGSGRREIQYCVTCHNTGSTDSDSGNTVDLKVMIHKIHRGASLPSVEAGGEYAIWGFRDTKHDYSMLHYPQDIRNCVNCHAGSATGAGRDDLVLTAQGDNWAEVPSGAACGSCHDSEGALGHINGKEDTDCASCHSQSGYAGSIANSHRNLIKEAREQFHAEILDVSNSMPGESPVVTFRISNPLTGEDYDIKNDPVFDGGIRVGTSWSTADFNNIGNHVLPQINNASQVQLDAVEYSSDNGDGSYSITMPPIPDGSEAPGVAATGSGMASIEGHPTVELAPGEEDPMATNIPLGDAHMFFSIDEPDGGATARRESVDIQQCLNCHDTLVLHGSNRTDNINTCVSCHNPRNTDLRQREIAMDPPTDGKREESVDFKTMIHGIHAAAKRENPLEIVGFRGFSTHRYTEDAVHYPGDLSNCSSCHTGDSYTLPLASGVLGTTVDTGEDRADPADDTVVTPAAAVCSSCHDDQVARSHMSSNGGNFATTQAALDSGEVVEECAVCHGEGRTSDVQAVHNPH
jgi:OmcA/MtrC family decaheme c-type cytochrome